jgi:hypothetical protein
LHRDEVAAGVLDRLRGHALEDAALGAALHRRIAVAGDVAGAAVKQAMIAPRGTGVDVVLLDEDAVDAAQGEVTGQRRARDAASDDQDLGLDGRWGIQFCLFSHAWPAAMVWRRLKSRTPYVTAQTLCRPAAAPLPPQA